MFLPAVWALILMAPIHGRESIGEQVMSNAKFLQISSDVETNSFTSLFLTNYSLKKISKVNF